MSRIKVNSIVNRFDNGAPTFPYSAVIPPSGTLTVNGSINAVGVSTLQSVQANSINSQTITATSFVGDGSGLTGLPIASQSKVVALKLILDPLPFRSWTLNQIL